MYTHCNVVCDFFANYIHTGIAEVWEDFEDRNDMTADLIKEYDAM